MSWPVTFQEVRDRVMVRPEVWIALGKEDPTNFTVVRTCALHEVAVGSWTWVGVGKEFLLYGVISPFVVRLALWHGGAPQLSRGLEADSREREGIVFLVRRAPCVATRRIQTCVLGSCRNESVCPSPYCTEVRSRARRRRERERVEE